jgi:hypothetical protein
MNIRELGVDNVELATRHTLKPVHHPLHVAASRLPAGASL